MTRIRYMMSAGSQGELRMRRGLAGLVGKDVYRWVFVCGVGSGVEALVRKWLVQWLDDFCCGLQVMCMPCFAGPARVRTRVVLNNARDLDLRDAVVRGVLGRGVCDGRGLHASVAYAG